MRMRWQWLSWTAIRLLPPWCLAVTGMTLRWIWPWTSKRLQERPPITRWERFRSVKSSNEASFTRRFLAEFSMLCRLRDPRRGKLGEDPRSKALHASCSLRKTGRGKSAEEAPCKCGFRRETSSCALYASVICRCTHEDVTVSDTVNTKAETNWEHDCCDITNMLQTCFETL